MLGKIEGKRRAGHGPHCAGLAGHVEQGGGVLAGPLWDGGIDSCLRFAMITLAELVGRV